MSEHTANILFKLGGYHLDCRGEREVKVCGKTKPRGYKKIFVLFSAEHEISIAHMYKNIKNFSFFSDSDKPRMLFFSCSAELSMKRNL